jgi:hypothetical protein
VKEQNTRTIHDLEASLKDVCPKTVDIDESGAYALRENCRTVRRCLSFLPSSGLLVSLVCTRERSHYSLKKNRGRTLYQVTTCKTAIAERCDKIKL